MVSGVNKGETWAHLIGLWAYVRQKFGPTDASARSFNDYSRLRTHKPLSSVSLQLACQQPCSVLAQWNSSSVWQHHCWERFSAASQENISQLEGWWIMSMVFWNCCFYLDFDRKPAVLCMVDRYAQIKRFQVLGFDFPLGAFNPQIYVLVVQLGALGDSI